MFFYPHVISPIMQFIFSTALDGKIKAWLYDNLGSRVDYDAPGHWCTTMAYSMDGSRFISKFICNTLVRNTGVSTLFHFFSSFHVDCFLVGPARMVNHTWWNGMRVKAQ